MLTNERLKEIAGHPTAPPRPGDIHTEWVFMARELLALRSPRDAGDEEVEDLARDADNGIGTDWYWNRADCGKASECLEKLKLACIARGQQLEQLQVQLAGCLCAAEGSYGAPVAKQGDYGWSLAYQKTLELHQQLREAREEIERLTEENKRLHDESEVSDSLVLTLQEEVKMLTYERDEARKELTELRTAPGMEEIDAILRGVNSSMFDNQERLASVSRRAIVSREAEKQRAEEAVGLLKWWVSFKDGFGQLEGMSAGSAVEEWKDNARRILEIVEGK